MAQFSRTWWGRRFLEALEQFTDRTRLSRGRAYARTGKILSYRIENGTVTARVRGKANPYFGVFEEPIYTTTIATAVISLDDWIKVIDQLATSASFVARLLMNEMPDSIDDVLNEFGINLLPHDQDDFVTTCTCPDWSNPCKHVAGLYSQLAADLDSDPFLLFELRGLSRETLRQQLATSRLGQVLAAELAPRENDPEPVASRYTRPEQSSPLVMGYREFWLGAKRLPVLDPLTPPGVPALLIKKQGDYPTFWHKDTSFIETMEDVYERVRARSPELK
jgi:uncharacterized Zn finger protein